MNTNSVSIIVPTYQEAPNIPELIVRIARIKFLGEHEVILMDDNSNDGIIEIVTKLQATYPWLKLIVLEGKRSLSKAILLGFEYARFDNLVTMDADLSHPPEVIPAMIDALENSNAEMVIGSRYVKGGSVEKRWPFRRKLISRVSAVSARLLVKVSDPLSGFIAIKKNVCYRGANLKPISWKIGLEIMIKSPCKKVHEIPIRFSDRKLGKTKLNYKEAFKFLCHLVYLIFYKVKRIF